MDEEIRLCEWCQENELKHNQEKYCSQICYREASAKKNREYLKSKKAEPERFPDWKCPNGHWNKLIFNPIKEKIRWRQFSCSVCGVKVSDQIE